MKREDWYKIPSVNFAFVSSTKWFALRSYNLFSFHVSLTYDIKPCTTSFLSCPAYRVALHYPDRCGRTIVTRHSEREEKNLLALRKKGKAAHAPIFLHVVRDARSPKSIFARIFSQRRSKCEIRAEIRSIASCLSVAKTRNSLKASKAFRSSIKGAYTVSHAIELYEMSCTKKRRKITASRLSEFFQTEEARAWQWNGSTSI